MKALEIDNLSVAYQTEAGEVVAVRGVNLDVASRQTVGLVGESGSGKTTLALGAINYLSANGRVTDGTARLSGTELLARSRRDMREIWGSRIGLVSQDPQAAFNPSLTIARQLDEMGRRHLGAGRRGARDLTLTMLARVEMPDPRSVVDRYPHQLSGGMLQRAAIAMAMLTSPELLILDEPTTALDVTTQAMVLDLLDDLKAEFNSAILYITHNLGVVARVCDRVAVMYAGEILEEAEVASLFGRPLHPYTLNLLNCVPRLERERGAGRLATIAGALPSLEDLPIGCVFAPRCPLALESCRQTRPPLVRRADGHETSCVRWELLLSSEGRSAALQQPAALPLDPLTAPTPMTLASTGHFVDAAHIAKIFPSRGTGSGTRAVDGVTVWMDRRRTLGLVGESGSGKTTLARVVAGLSAPTGGTVSMEGKNLGATTGGRDRSVLRRLQMVFQQPEASLNPRRTVGQAIARPLAVLGGLDRETAHRRAHELLEAVRLPSSYYDRYPAELSGGEQQRVAIARAFAAGPDLVICDEPISSLDVSVQGSLMNLLMDLQEEQGTSYLFISHDLAAVQHLSHRIAVMYLGRLMEQGEAALVLAAPYHPYTEALLSAVPLPDPGARQARVRLRSGAPATDEIPSGCRFHPRCPRYLGAVCRDLEPPWQTAAGDHSIYCHIPLHELARLQEAE